MAWLCRMRRPRPTLLSKNDLDWFAARLSIAVYDTNAEYYRSLWEDEQMALKLQGVAAKMAMLQHNAEADAEKLNAAIDAADAKRLAVMPKAVAKIAETAGQLAEVESFVASIDQVTNGGPALNETPLPPAPQPVAEPSGSVDHTSASGENVPGVTTY
jgi:hypothetical protein